MRKRLVVRALHVLTAMTMCAAMASPADAQLGRLKKAAQDLAKDKLAKETGSTSAAAKSSSSGGDSYVITPEYIDLVLASLERSVAEAEQLQASKRASAEYAKRQEAAKLCIDKAAQSYNPMKSGAPSEATSAEISRISDAAAAVQTRAIEAMQRGDRRTHFAAQDTASVLMQQSALLTLGGSCTIPYLPMAVLDAQLAEHAASASDNLDPTPETKTRMTRTQFGRVRERIALWALLQDDPSLKVGSDGVFKPEEQQALGARSAELKRLTPYLKDNTLRWSTWGDVSSW